MIVTRSILEVRTTIDAFGAASIGLVPTMGYLHDGHMALVRQASADNERVAASIYVNPKQFGPGEDLSRYPRDLERDLRLLASAGVDLVFARDDASMYPPDYQTRVIVSEVTRHLEGARRPTHFEGVTTVVAKLFNIIHPARAYFGQKDAQQTVVVRQMVRDLNFEVEIVVCPTVRESDGLAMSSRNKYLDPEQRLAAPVLYRSLKSAEALWLDGHRDSDSLRAAMEHALAAEPLAKVEYVSVAHVDSLIEWQGSIPTDERAIFSMAVQFGKTRLIDNLLVG